MESFNEVDTLLDASISTDSNICTCTKSAEDQELINGMDLIV